MYVCLYVCFNFFSGFDQICNVSTDCSKNPYMRYHEFFFSWWETTCSMRKDGRVDTTSFITFTNECSYSCTTSCGFMACREATVITGTLSFTQTCSSVSAKFQVRCHDVTRQIHAPYQSMSSVRAEVTRQPSYFRLPRHLCAPRVSWAWRYSLSSYTSHHSALTGVCFWTLRPFLFRIYEMNFALPLCLLKRHTRL